MSISYAIDRPKSLVRTTCTGEVRFPEDPARLRGVVEELTRRLEEQDATLSSQDSQIQELQERSDFAERLMTDARDRHQLDPKGE